MRAIGLMSGTSMDGIDVALIETDGETVTRFGPSALHFYQDDEVALLRRAMEAAPALRSRAERPGVIARGRGDVDRAARRARSTRSWPSTRSSAASVDVVGFHGQTMLHRPEERLTVQIGDGAALARATGIAGGLRFPRRRRRGRRAGRAARAGLSPRARAHARRGRIRSRCSISAASPTSPSSTATAIRSPATPGRAMR